MCSVGLKADEHEGCSISSSGSGGQHSHRERNVSSQDKCISQFYTCSNFFKGDKWIETMPAKFQTQYNTISHCRGHGFGIFPFNLSPM